MPDTRSLPTDPIYSSGDILVEEAEGGSYQVSRVSANGVLQLHAGQKQVPAVR